MHFSIPDAGRIGPRIAAAVLLVVLVGGLAMTVAESADAAVRWVSTLVSVAAMLLVAGVLAPVRLDGALGGRYDEALTIWRGSPVGRLLATDRTLRLAAALGVAAVVATIELAITTAAGTAGLFASCLAIAASLGPIYLVLLYLTWSGTPRRGALAAFVEATFPGAEPGAWLAGRFQRHPRIDAAHADRIAHAITGAAVRTLAAVLARTAFAAAVFWIGGAIAAGFWWPLVSVAALAALVVIFSDLTELLLGRGNALISVHDSDGAVHMDSEAPADPRDTKETRND